MSHRTLTAEALVAGYERGRPVLAAPATGVIPRDPAMSLLPTVRAVCITVRR